MKKETFQGVLCLLTGILVAVMAMAFMFKNLHWPGGNWLIALIIPALLVEAISLSCYIAKYGALKSCDKPAAKHLLRIESVAVIALAVLCIAFMFRFLHWPGAAWLILISCITLAVLSFLAGIFACVLLNKK